MKKVSFLLDEDTDKLLKALAKYEDISKSDLIRHIVRREAKLMAYRAGIIDWHEIEVYISK